MEPATTPQHASKPYAACSSAHCAQTSTAKVLCETYRLVVVSPACGVAPRLQVPLKPMRYQCYNTFGITHSSTVVGTTITAAAAAASATRIRTASANMDRE